MTTKSQTETNAKKLALRRQSLRALTTTNLEQVRGGFCSADTGHFCALSTFTK